MEIHTDKFTKRKRLSNSSSKTNDNYINISKIIISYHIIKKNLSINKSRRGQRKWGNGENVENGKGIQSMKDLLSRFLVLSLWLIKKKRYIHRYTRTTQGTNSIWGNGTDCLCLWSAFFWAKKDANANANENKSEERGTWNV